jgi:histidinol-phosphate aminotransferase
MTPLKLRPEVVALAAYVPGKRAQPGFNKLSSNEAIATPQVARDAAALVLDALHLYPDTAASAVTAAIADHHGVRADQVSVGVGSVEVISQAIHALAQAGDEVVFPWRTFEAYPLLVAGAGATPVAVPLDADGRNDPDALLDALSPATTCVVVCNPNNPTGTSVAPDALAAFIDAVPRSVLVVVDEAYVQFIDGEVLDVVALAAERPNVLAVRTFSKAYGMAGLRIGYGVGASELIATMRKLSLPFAVSGLAQDAAVAALADDSGMRANVCQVRKGRARLEAAARTAGVGFLPSSANFVWLPADPPAVTAIVASLEEAGLLVRPFPEGVRISIGDDAATDAVIAALPSIAAVLGGRGV